MLTSRPGTVELFGCQIDRLDMEATVERCAEAIDKRENVQHVCINAAKVVALQDDPEMRAIVASCAIVNADGQSIVWASKLLGKPLPERVAGIDLMFRLFALAQERGYRVYVLGAADDVLEKAMAELGARYPQLQVAGHHHGYFTADEQPAIARRIRQARPDILFVAISSPTKEYFLGRYGPQLAVPLVMGVGGAIDILAGVTRRAPRAWHGLGLEWLYRVVQEPRRMWKRYTVGNACFIWLLLRAIAARAIPVVPAPEAPPDQREVLDLERRDERAGFVEAATRDELMWLGEAERDDAHHEKRHHPEKHRDAGPHIAPGAPRARRPVPPDPDADPGAVRSSGRAEGS